MTLSENRIGISLSGGGYRASAFHLGTLKKLDELQILSKAFVLSTISGGSITGACYAIHEGDFQSFYKRLYEGLQKKSVVRKAFLSWLGFKIIVAGLLLLFSIIFLFTSYSWIAAIIFFLTLFIIVRFQFVLFPVSKTIEAIYSDFFCHQKTLANLRDQPALVISSTNLQTSRPFIFSKNRMGDSAYANRKSPILFKHSNFPLARAVMASTCVPFAFTPVRIKKEFFVHEADAETVHPMLVDGGVYDNQGIHRLMQKGEFDCPIVITSDAGGGSTGEISAGNTVKLLMETVNVFLNRIKNVQMVNDVYENAKEANKEIAYLSLGWDVERCIPGFVDNLAKKQVTQTVIAAHALRNEWVAGPKKYEKEIIDWLEQRLDYAGIEKPTVEEKRIARRVTTSLGALSRQEVDCLIKQAEALTELQVKLYCPSIFN